MSTTTDEKLKQLEDAANDPLFWADLEETMTAFSSVDSEGWLKYPWGIARKATALERAPYEETR